MIDRGSIKAIGGSNIASILGKNPYESAHSLYLRLTGELPPKDDNDVMRWGRELESRVADMFADGHDEYTIEPHGMVTHPDYDFLIASPDRILLQDGKPVGVLEIKTSDIGMRQEFGEQMTDEIPFHFLLQLTWYLGMMNLSEGYVAVYFRKPGRKAFAAYQEHYVKFNSELYDFMVSQAVGFWNNHVVPQVPPEITEPDPETIRYLKTKYPSHTPGKFAYSDEAIDSLASEYLQLTADNKMREERADAMKLQLIAAIGANEGIVTALGKFTYRQCKPSQKIDWEGAARSLGVSSETIAKFTTERPGHRTFLTPKGRK